MVYHQTLGYQKIPFWDSGFIVDDSLSVNAMSSLYVIIEFHDGICLLLRYQCPFLCSFALQTQPLLKFVLWKVMTQLQSCQSSWHNNSGGWLQCWEKWLHTCRNPGNHFFIIKHCHQFNFITKKNLTGYLVVVVYFDTIRQKMQEWWACKLVDTLNNRSWE